MKSLWSTEDNELFLTYPIILVILPGLCESFFSLFFKRAVLWRFECRQEESLHLSSVKHLTNPQNQGNSDLRLKIQTDTSALLILPQNSLLLCIKVRPLTSLNAVFFVVKL